MATVEEKLKHLDDLYAQNRIDEAEKFLLREIDENNVENSILIKISLNNELMGIYRNKGDRERCMKQLMQQMIWMSDAGDQLDPLSEATLYLNVANAYQAFDMLEDSYDILCRVEESYRANLDSNDFRLASLYNNKAVVLMKLKDLDQAEVYFKMALAILRTLREAEDEIAVTYQNLSNIYSDKGKFGLALDNANEGAKLLESIGMGVSYHAGAIANSIAIIYYKMGDYENALKYFNKSADIILKVFGDCELYQSILRGAQAMREKLQNG